MNTSVEADNIPDDRCGYVADCSQFPGPPGSITCFRETWRDGRCIWHSDSESKPVSELIKSRSDYPERLDGAILRKIELRDQISFEDCNLDDADFTQSNLMGANCRDAKLGGADFVRSNLPGTDFTGAYLHGTNFKDANMTNTIVECAKISEITNFENISLSEGTSFEGKSGWESDADRDALKHSYLANKISYRLRVFGRHHSDLRDLQYAARQYRHLQRLLRENNLHQSPKLTIREKHVRRKQALAEKDYFTWLKFVFYRWPLGYGEKIRNVVATSILTIIGFSIIYPFVGGVEAGPNAGILYNFNFGLKSPIIIPEWIEVFGLNLYFSSVTFTTLGYGDIQPASFTVQTLASVESFIGALLMAFLVFVLGRRATW